MPGNAKAAALAIGLLLGGCGGGNLGNGQSGPGAVPLATTADALRELGNAIAAARLAQSPAPGGCSSGSDNITGPGTKSRAFVYFNSSTDPVTYPVTYEVHVYSACVDGGNTLDGLLETGATSDGAYTYAVRGSQAAVLQLSSSGTNGSGAAVSIVQRQVGTIETHVSGTQTEVRSGLATTSEQTPQSGGSPTYQGSFSLGVNGPTFDVLSDSSGNGGNGSRTIAGNYTYASTICTGGAETTATVATPSALLLTPSSDGSYHYASGGTLSLSSGTSAVTYTFSGSGATLSGSVSGSLSSSEVQQAFSAGSGC